MLSYHQLLGKGVIVPVTTPKYAQLANHFRDQIRTGVLKPGDRLPSITELLAEYGYSAHTIRSAMLTLKAEQLVEGRVGEGVFVRDPSDDRS